MNNREDKTFFYKANKHFMSADSFECEGKIVKLTPTCKLVYYHMQDQYNSYKSKGNPYYEEQLIIGLSVGVSESSVKTAIKLLEKCGLVVVTRLKTGVNRRNNQYKVLDVGEVGTVFLNEAYQKEYQRREDLKPKKAPKPEPKPSASEEHQGVSLKESMSMQPPVEAYNHFPEDDDDSEIPF